MPSILYRWFLSWKVLVGIDEVKRNQKSTLCLTNCDLKGFSCEEMMKVSNSSVIRLLLHRNDISELTEDFGLSGRKLQFLSLAYNRMTRLPVTFGELDVLTRLNISHNDFSLEGFPLVLCKLKGLRVLWANGIGIKELPPDVQELTELRLLGLRNNAIGAFPVSILNLTKLQWLTLAGNSIPQIPSDLSRLDALIHLNLSYNNISRLQLVPWTQMQKLRYVFLEFNNLLVDDKMIRTIQELPNLAKADLSGNENIGATAFDGIVTPQTQTSLEVETLWEHASVHSSTTNCVPSESSEVISDFRPGSMGRSGNSISNLSPATGPMTSAPFQSKRNNSLDGLNTSNQSSPSHRGQRDILQQTEFEDFVSSRSSDSNSETITSSESESSSSSREATTNASLRRSSPQAPIKTRNHFHNKGPGDRLAGLTAKLIEEEALCVNKRRSDPVHVCSDQRQKPDGRIRDELFTVSRIRSENEVPDLVFLPRTAGISTYNSSSSLRITEYLEEQANLSSFKHKHNEHNTRNGSEPLVSIKHESSNEIDPAYEPESNHILEEPPEQNPEFVPVENNDEAGGNPEVELLFIPDQEQGQDAQEPEEIWDHSERSEDLDKMEIPSDDDDDIQDLPLEEIDEKLILYSIMLS